MLRRNLNCVACQHILLVDSNKSHVDIILWHVNMIYRACSWQKYYIMFVCMTCNIYMSYLAYEEDKPIFQDIRVSLLR